METKKMKRVGWTATGVVLILSLVSLITKGPLLEFWMPTLAGIVLGIIGIVLRILETAHRHTDQK
jgi:uncharacterized membrane protein